MTSELPAGSAGGGSREIEFAHIRGLHGVGRLLVGAHEHAEQRTEDRKQNDQK